MTAPRASAFGLATIIGLSLAVVACQDLKLLLLRHRTIRFSGDQR